MIGCWHDSPIGPFADIMWGTASGERVLISPDVDAERFITGVYSFDRTMTTSFEVTADERSVRVVAPPLEITLEAGSGWRIPMPRPLWFTRWIEGPVARLAMGVNTYGVSPTGVREWYQASVWRPVVSGAAYLDGVDLGALAPIAPPLGVGFTDPPARPSIVTVRPSLSDRSGALGRLVDATDRT